MQPALASLFTESTERFLLTFLDVSSRAVDPVGVLGDVLDFIVLLPFGGVFEINGDSCGRCSTLNTVISMLRSKTVVSVLLSTEPLKTPLFPLDSDDCMLYSLMKPLISVSISWIVSHLPIFIFSSFTLLWSVSFTFTGGSIVRKLLMSCKRAFGVDDVKGLGIFDSIFGLVFLSFACGHTTVVSSLPGVIGVISAFVASLCVH